jgi:CheY-like chemotaxis protein
VGSNQRAAQLRAMVARLSQAEQRERRRLSQVLHDHLQQLLVAARMKAQRLRHRAEHDESLAQIADEVDERIDQCITESRSLTVELSPPVLYDGGLAAGLDWLARRVEEQNGLPVEVAADRAADPADMDLRVFLFQGVRELLFNVVKHAHATRARVVMAKMENGELRIEVRDDGLGCDPERLASRANSAGGFGLFNVRERLELLGGRLDIDTAPGKGTRMGIVIPPSKAATTGETARAKIGPVSDRHAAPTPGILSKSQGGLRVLLADDHPVVRKGMADLLREQAGIDVVIEARDGQEAVDLALEARPDVVVMDITMPRMDGIEATRRIKAELPQVRVIGLSMHEDVNMAKAMCEAGASDYLRKDIPSDALIAAILCYTRGMGN